MKIAKNSKPVDISAATNTANVPAKAATALYDEPKVEDTSTLPDKKKALEYIQQAIDELGKLSDEESRDAIANLAVIMLDLK